MAILDSGPCEPWPHVCDDFPDAPDSEQQVVIESSLMAATEALWNRSHRRFGLCSMKLRPCQADCWPPGLGWWPSSWWQVSSSWSWPFPVLHGGRWFNLVCGWCGSNCSCNRVEQVALPSPVAEISEVRIDGVVLDPSAYRVDDWRWLVRLDGGDWPRCNDLNSDDTGEGTWSVTASYGEQVPALGQMAVGELAGAIYKRCIGAKDCPLPSSTIQQVQRQGVTKVFFDADTAFANGKIGLYFTDLFVATYNPRNNRPAKIHDIDKPKARNVGSVSPTAP